MFTKTYEILGSVNLAIFLISISAAAVLVGSWCPQASQVGRQKVVEQFGEAGAEWLERFGITDIFHSPFFLMLVTMLAINLLAASFQRVFPRAISRWKQKLVVMDEEHIESQPFKWKQVINLEPTVLLSFLGSKLHSAHYTVRLQGNKLAAQRGKIGSMAAAVTHVGLITLLVGATVTSWTGFSGFEAVARGGMLTFMSSEHSKLWIGKLPDWKVKVEDTYRINYDNGDPKQWYSDLVVTDVHGKELKRQKISVNNPLSFDGIDIYQSSWAFDRIMVSFNETSRALELHSMGRVLAAFVPLDPHTILIFSVKDTTSPLRVFAKTNNWASPRLITTIAPGMTAQLGSVKLRYDGPIPTTGLQYKSDPGFPLTLTGFIFIIAGVALAAVPHRQLWISVKAVGGQNSVDNTKSVGEVISEVIISGATSKAKRSFEHDVDKLLQELT